MSRKKLSPAAMMEVPLTEFVSIIEQAQRGAISAEAGAKLKALVDTFLFLKTELENKGASIERLRKMLFGKQSEKTHKVLGEKRRSSSRERPKTKGHGKNAAAAFTGARKVAVPHPAAKAGDECPEPGCVGKVYALEPARLVRITGMAPLNATVYELQRLRCALCGKLLKAPAPEGIGENKYDESATAMVATLKYGTSTPFYRLEKLQDALGMPMPASTQWDLAQEGSTVAVFVHRELIRAAAQAAQMHNDDTKMRILELTEAERARLLGEKESKGRTGVFTSGIVSVAEGHRIALFFTGPRHAGENLAEVLKKRAAQLAPPVHMSDGLGHNSPKEFKTLILKCLLHARRRYVEVVNHFPEEVRFVLETLRGVYVTDARARASGLTPSERLALHQEESGPRMTALKHWMAEQFARRLIEPNSGLGAAIRHMDKNWEALTAFLHVAGAPLDNNLCERALKKAVLHRKNALFYKTLTGAGVGDLYMSLIYTAELNGINPFDYLVALLKHPEQIKENPQEWMPWNYRKTLAGLTSTTSPPA